MMIDCGCASDEGDGYGDEDCDVEGDFNEDGDEEDVQLIKLHFLQNGALLDLQWLRT